MNNINENSLEILKNNLEIVKLMKFIDESPLTDEFKTEIKSFLFSINRDDNYSFSENVLKSNLQFNNLIHVIKETILSFNSISEEANKFEDELKYNIAHFYNNVFPPRHLVSDKTANMSKIRVNMGIYYLHDYVPTNTPKDFLYKFSLEKQETSRQIWEEYKHNDEEAVKRFTKELMCAVSWISNNELHEDIERVCLISVPSSTHERDINSPIRKSIDIMESWYKCGKGNFEFNFKLELINGRFLLYRFTDVPTGHKVRKDERPKYSDHINSIKVSDEKQFLSLDNTVFIIIDDITTRGEIMRACFDKLKESGISRKNIVRLVIGKTVWWSR